MESKSERPAINARGLHASTLATHGYRFEAECGSTNTLFGGMFVARNARGHRCAVKISAWDMVCSRRSVRWGKAMDDPRAEVATLKSLPPHPHIIRYIEDFSDEYFHYLVTEYVHGLDLVTFFQRDDGKDMTMERASLVARDLMTAIVHMHAHGVAHRDISCENVMVVPVSDADGTVWFRAVLIDFGASIMLGHEDNARLQQGRQGIRRWAKTSYRAPEMRLNLKGPVDWKKTDVFAAAVVIWCALIHALPFHEAVDGDERWDVLQQDGGAIMLAAHQGRHHGITRVPHNSIDTLRCMLEPNPFRRLSAAAVLRAGWLRLQRRRPAIDKPCQQELAGEGQAHKPDLDHRMPTPVHTAAALADSEQDRK